MSPPRDRNTPASPLARSSTDRLITSLVLCLLGLLAAIALGRAAVAMLVTPWFVLLVLGLSSTRRREPSVTVAVDRDRVVAGDEVEVTVTIGDADGVVSATVDPVSPLGSASESRTPARAAVVQPARPATLSIPVDADRWGSFDFGRIRLDVAEPYGLTRWRGTVVDPTPVRVHPSGEQIRTLLAPWLVRRSTGAHVSRAVGRGVEYADLRPYGPGDSLRDINWRVSARTGDLWVSQRHPDRSTDVILLLDSFVESGHDARTMFGLAIEAAMALANSHLALTDRVGLVEMGGLVRWVVPGTGRQHLQRLIDVLLSTRLLANVADKDLAMIAPRALPPRSFVVALSPLLDERFTDALFELAGRGHDVTVVECDPSAPLPDDADQVSRLARRIWWAERAMLRARLAERGVAVATWEPGTPLDATLRTLDLRRRRVAPPART